MAIQGILWDYTEPSEVIIWISIFTLSPGKRDDPHIIRTKNVILILIIIIMFCVGDITTSVIFQAWNINGPNHKIKAVQIIKLA